MTIKRDIISNRYVNDGAPLKVLEDISKRDLKYFLNDKRIEYIEILRCPLCKCEDSIAIAEKERHGIPLETIVCNNCGLVRSSKQLNGDSTNIFYSEYYRNIYEPMTDKMVEMRYDLLKEKSPLKCITKDMVVLEIDCGGGWNLVPFHKNGYKYYGFDFDTRFIDHGIKKGLNLFIGGVKEAEEAGIGSDFLIIDQVLEH